MTAGPRGPTAGKIKRLARVLWDEHRREVQTGGTIPAYDTYADGAQEPCEWEEQDAKLRRYFVGVARRMVREAKL